MTNLGFFNTSGSRTVVRFPFTSHTQTGAPGAPSSAFEAADVVIYKDGSATQRASASGITMTSPFDSVTGLHYLSINLTDNADPDFYAAGSTYDVVLIPDETVDSLAVVAVLARFEIGVAKADVTEWKGATAPAMTGDSFAVVNDVATGNVATKELLDAVAAYVDTEVAAIKAKTDGLPADPADESQIQASIADLKTYVDTEIAAIKAKTDNLPANPAAVGSVMQFDLTQLIDATPVEGSVGEALQGAAANLGDETISGTTYTKKTPDGSTAAVFTLNDADAPTSRTRQ